MSAPLIHPQICRDSRNSDPRTAMEAQRSDANRGVQTPPRSEIAAQIPAGSHGSSQEGELVPDGSINEPRPVIADLGARTMTIAHCCTECGGALDSGTYEDVGEWCFCGGGDG